MSAEEVARCLKEFTGRRGIRVAYNDEALTVCECLPSLFDHSLPGGRRSPHAVDKVVMACHPLLKKRQRGEGQPKDGPDEKREWQRSATRHENRFWGRSCKGRRAKVSRSER